MGAKDSKIAKKNEISDIKNNNFSKVKSEMIEKEKITTTTATEKRLECFVPKSRIDEKNVNAYKIDLLPLTKNINKDCIDSNNNEAIISVGQDRRRKVLDPNKYPFSCIGLVFGTYEIFDENSSKIVKRSIEGTGTLISSNLVITCAHNVYHKDTKTWYNLSFLLKPDNSYFLEEYNVVKAYIPEEYYKNDEEDYAILVLEKPIGNEYGSLGLATNYVIKDNTPYCLYGYPSEKCSKNNYSLWGMEGTANNKGLRLIANSQKVMYDALDTEAGQSGSSIWFRETESRCYIFAIHCKGSKKFNSGIYLNDARTSQIEKWIKDEKLTFDRIDLLQNKSENAFNFSLDKNPKFLSNLKTINTNKQILERKIDEDKVNLFLIGGVSVEKYQIINSIIQSFNKEYENLLTYKFLENTVVYIIESPDINNLKDITSQFIGEDVKTHDNLKDLKRYLRLLDRAVEDTKTNDFREYQRLIFSSEKKWLKLKLPNIDKRIRLIDTPSVDNNSIDNIAYLERYNYFANNVILYIYSCDNQSSSLDILYLNKIKDFPIDHVVYSILINTDYLQDVLHRRNDYRDALDCYTNKFESLRYSVGKFKTLNFNPIDNKSNIADLSQILNEIKEFYVFN